MAPARVVSVAPASPAEAAGVLAGDEILFVNGEDLRDVIRYQVQVDEPHVELDLRRGGLEHLVVVDKNPGEPLGLALDSAVFDRVRTCDNHCPFCFIYQLPKGMRRSLSLKDDDYRLSFLYGNFTTLTRFTEADLERVIGEHLSPLYVSIHATDPDLRATLLRNRRGATSLRWLSAILDADIEVHGQVVVCPGINDGDALDDTLLGILERFDRIATVGVVPLGVSAHSREQDMRSHSEAEACAVLDVVDRWQDRFLRALGRRLVYASDEYYLLANRPFPTVDAYDGFPQHENGIGMAQTFSHEVRSAAAGFAVEGTGVRSGFFAWVEGAPGDGYRAPRASETRSDATSVSVPVPVALGRTRVASTTPTIAEWSGAAVPVAVLTGEFGARVLEPLLPTLREVAGTPVRIIPIANQFFGGNIAVTGLLTGVDVSAALAAQPGGERYLLPDVVLSNGQFLDGLTVADLARPVEVVATDGTSLVAALSR